MDIQRLLKHCKVVLPDKRFQLIPLKLLDKNKIYTKIAFFMNGTTGFTDNSLNYMRILHKFKFLIIAPDHNFYHKNICKYHQQKKICGHDTKFHTTKRFAAKNPHIYSYITKFRTLELSSIYKHFFQIFPHLSKSFQICVGVSEGAIATSIAKIPVHLKFVFSYSIEKNYFTKHKPYFKSFPTQKVIQVIGSNDQFFGKSNSIASFFHNVRGFSKSRRNLFIHVLPFQHHSLLYKPSKHSCKTIKNILKFYIKNYLMLFKLI